MEKLIIRKAAVLGAGVMGAQIAAHLANADIPVVLFDLPSKEGDKSAIAKKALDSLKKLNPTPLAKKDRLQYIDAANYDDHLVQLSECDLVIEAIAERMDWKNDLYAKITPHLRRDAIIASNTSGLSINTLASGLPDALRPQFCGIHFFNPPRYMRLVEIIPTSHTAPELSDTLETWLTSRLGKGVIRALDTPNFVANRVGVFSLLAVMHHTHQFGLGFDEVDELTGTRIGRSKSATYRTLDVVGLDTLSHVVRTMHETLPEDPWHSFMTPPNWVKTLIDNGALGQKTRAGVFKKQGKDILVFDPVSNDYRATVAKLSDEVTAILKINEPAKKFAALRSCNDPQAQFLWSIFRDLFHYCAVQLENIAHCARDVDLAIRWGFGWSQGPFELWQAAGWQSIALAILEDINAGKSMSKAPLPAWVLDGRTGVHTPEGSWSANRKRYLPVSDLPVYKRQLFPESVLGSTTKSPTEAGETLFENDGVRLWRLPEIDKGIGIISFKSKMHALGDEVLEGVSQALRQAEASLAGVVIWHEAPFAVGANLKQIAEACAAGRFDLLEQTVLKFQSTTQLLKYAQVPVVAAIQGMALGGGCEFAMHSTKRILALESYLGLVEAGVGLIPAGGGCKEFAINAAQWASSSATPKELTAFLQPVFQAISMGKVSGSAQEAISYGFVKPSDTILFNADELLYVALKEARCLADAGYAPPLMPRGIPVAGRAGIALMEMMLVNMKDGAMISPHDYKVARAAAVAICGGEIEGGSLVDEEWLLGIERQLFVELLRTPETQARIVHMLETGKPLRN